MDSLLLLTLTISLMFTGGQCASESMSCSSVNGKMVCEKQRSDGNFAGAASNAMAGPGVSFMDASAMTGNTNTGQSYSSRTSEGNIPPGVPNVGSFAGGHSPSFGVSPSFGDISSVPSGIGFSDSANTGTSSTFVTSSLGGAGAGEFARPSSGEFARPSGGFVGSAGFGGSSGFVGGGFPPSFGVSPSFGDGSSVPFGTSFSVSANTGTASTFVPSSSGGTGAGGFAGSSSGGFARPSSGGFVGSAAGGFAGFDGSRGFSDGGVPPSFSGPPTFIDGSSVSSGTSFKDSASTFVTSGLDGAGSGGFTGPPSGGFVGSAAAGGFAGFGGSGGFAGGGYPPSFGDSLTFGDGSRVRSGISFSDSGNTGSSSTFVTSNLDRTGAGGFSGPSGGFVGSAVGGFAGFDKSSGFAVGNLPQAGAGAFAGNGVPFDPFNFVFGGGFPFGRR